jgi:3-hydroxyacyl-[acyl-carrier protein] dehydratase/trans-2-decenoyl-[acyl-carrier protein] isomerase
MRYAEFLERTHFSKTELIAHSRGKLIEDPPSADMAQLPAPPFLMFDRITKLERSGNSGILVAEQDIDVAAWYFQCHFAGDPVQPGCLGLDAVWQLIGFYCMTAGAVGRGRALGCEQVEFNGQIRPYDCQVRYELKVRRFANSQRSGSAIAIADAEVFVDNAAIYQIKGARVGCFTGIGYTDYPNPESPQARGGIIQR